MKKFIALLGLYLFILAASNTYGQSLYDFSPNLLAPNGLTGDTWSVGQHKIVIVKNIIYIIWTQPSSNNGDDIYFARSDDGGNTFSSPIMVNDISGTANMPSLASLAVDSVGHIYVVWGDPVSYDVHFTKSTDGGVTFEPSRVVNDGESLVTYELIDVYPTIAVDAIGNIYVAWVDFRNSVFPDNYKSDIYFAKSTDGGVTFTPNIKINVNDEVGTARQFQPALAVDNAGNVYITWWTDYRNYGAPDPYQPPSVNFSKSADDGTTFGPNLTVDNTGWMPTLSVDTLGNIYMTWNDNGNYPGVIFAKSTDGGTTFSHTIVDSSSVWSVPSALSVDALGNVYMVWSDWADRIYFAKSTDGITFSAIDHLGVWGDYPYIAVDTSSNPYIVWTGFWPEAGVYFAKGQQKILDTTPPVVTISATPNILWPPDHKLVDVQINGSAVDNGSGIASVVITVTDEYGKYNMTVPGFGSTIQLEAWRNGDDRDGRQYTITAVATDKAGNQATATTQVVVPHDMGK